MPAADSERYQSRLLNFFHQKTRNWGEKVQQTLRHVKVNANWSLEAILHSAVLMMRKVVESPGKRLKPGQQPDNPQVDVQSYEQEKNNAQIIHQPKGAIAFLDRAIAKFESNAIVPVSLSSKGFLAFIQNQWQIFVYGQKSVQSPDNRQKKIIPPIFSQAFESLIDRVPNNTNKLRLITHQKIPVTVLPPEKSPNPDITDPWLTLDDLFADSQQTPAEETESDVSDTSPNPPSWTWRNPYQKPIKKAQPNTELVQQNSPISSLSASETANNQLETKPEWIETQAEIVGYAQHPLEKILQFLDNGMLWLEEKIVTVFRLIQRLWRRS
jgi:hypothetical protein